MDNLVYIGRLVNTHGIKGEVKILSDFEYKDKVFVPGMHFYIDDEELIVTSYRHHQNFDMVTFESITDINDVLKYKGKDVYIKKEEINLNEGEILESDLIGLNVIFNGTNIGTIKEIEKYSTNKVLLINDYRVPYHDNFIEKIDLNKKQIVLKNVSELIK